MEEKNEKIIQIVIASILFVGAIIVDKLTDFNNIILFFIYLIPYCVAAYDTFKEAFKELREGNIFSEQFLMVIASLGAMLIGFVPGAKAEFAEGIFVMLFFQVGELFEIIAEGQSEKSIESLMEIRPDYANLLKGDKSSKVDPNDVIVDDIILVNPGEKVPLDGIVIEGESSVDTLAITGESVPRRIVSGEEIYSGYVNKSGVLKIKVTKLFENSTVNKIIDLVKNASQKKSSSEKFISKFSKIYTPIVILLAVCLAIIPSIITSDPITWISRALSFLVVSCPCALVISVPLAYFGGIGGASKYGVLFKGSNYLEDFAKISTIVFDKTGTLTEGVFEVVATHPKEFDEKELLHLAAHVEEHSTHPIAMSLVNGYKKYDDSEHECIITDVEEIAGYGVKAIVNNQVIYVGSSKYMKKLKINFEECEMVGSVVHVATDGKYYGHIVISDKLKPGTSSAIKYLNNNRIKTVMLTGDSNDIAKDIASKLGITNYHGELLPEEKVNKLEELLNKDEVVAFIGDGINDAPVLARSNIGISMGAIGSDAAIEASDVVIMNDDLLCLKNAMNIAKKTNLISKENIIFSIFIKVAVLVLSSVGITNMWMAVFADVGVTVIAVLNSMRTLKK